MVNYFVIPTFGIHVLLDSYAGAVPMVIALHLLSSCAHVCRGYCMWLLSLVQMLIRLTSMACACSGQGLLHTANQYLLLQASCSMGQS